MTKSLWHSLLDMIGDMIESGLRGGLHVTAVFGAKRGRESIAALALIPHTIKPQAPS